MATLATNNGIDNANNVANNVNENNGYNSEVTNEVVVLNGDTFYKKNIVVGQKYRYGSHYFTIDKFETRGTHLYYIGTLDKKPFENDLHALKVACECTERRAMNRSANDTENGKAVKVKRTTKESAQLIEAKYAKAIEAINNIVAKLNNSDKVADCLSALIESLNADCTEQVTAILDEAKAKQSARLARIEELSATLPVTQSKAIEAMQNGDFATGMQLGKEAQAMQAELLALQAEEANYIASLAPVEETASESEETESEATDETK